MVHAGSVNVLYVVALCAQVLLSKGVQESKILFLCLIAAPAGIHKVTHTHTHINTHTWIQKMKHTTVLQNEHTGVVSLCLESEQAGPLCVYVCVCLHRCAKCSPSLRL